MFYEAHDIVLNLVRLPHPGGIRPGDPAENVNGTDVTNRMSTDINHRRPYFVENQPSNHTQNFPTIRPRTRCRTTHIIATPKSTVEPDEKENEIQSEHGRKPSSLLPA